MIVIVGNAAAKVRFAIGGSSMCERMTIQAPDGSIGRAAMEGNKRF
jgi:hypothetical protein